MNWKTISNSLQWQLHWATWYRLPWRADYPADEDGFAETVCGVGPLQLRWIRWARS